MFSQTWVQFEASTTIELHQAIMVEYHDRNVTELVWNRAGFKISHLREIV